MLKLTQKFQKNLNNLNNNNQDVINIYLIHIYIIVLLEDDEVNFKWYHSFDQSQISTFNLPFVPQYDKPSTGNFDNWTLSLNATHPGLNNELEYNVHSLYGLMMA